MSSAEDGGVGGGLGKCFMLGPTLGVLHQVVGIPSGCSMSELEANPGVVWSRCWDLNLGARSPGVVSLGQTVSGMAVGNPSDGCGPILGISSGCLPSGFGICPGRSGSSVSGCSGFVWDP